MGGTDLLFGSIAPALDKFKNLRKVDFNFRYSFVSKYYWALICSSTSYFMISVLLYLNLTTRTIKNKTKTLNHPLRNKLFDFIIKKGFVAFLFID